MEEEETTPIYQRKAHAQAWVVTEDSDYEEATPLVPRSNIRRGERERGEPPPSPLCLSPTNEIRSKERKINLIDKTNSSSSSSSSFPSSSEGDGEIVEYNYDHIPNASPMAAFVNLFNCAVGAGVLSLPGAFQNMGILLAILIFVLMGAAALYSLNILVLDSIKVGVTTYDALVYRVFGFRIVTAFQVIVVLYTFGVSCGYVIIVGDLLPELIQVWAGYGKYETVPFLITQPLIQLYVTVFLFAPLTSFPRIDLLKYVSGFAVVAVLYFTFIVVYRSIEFMLSDEFEAVNSPTYFEINVSVFRGIPIVAFALGGHVQCISVFSELKDKDRTKKKFLMISSTMIAALSLIYLLVAVFSYFQYLPNTGNILKEMLDANPGDVFIEISSLMMAAVVIFSYPLYAFAMRLSLEQLIFQGKPTPTIARIALTSIILFLTYIIAVLVTDLSVVFGLTGAAGATLIKFVFPAIIHLRLHYLDYINLSILQQLPCYLLIISGIAVGALGVVFILIDAA